LLLRLTGVGRYEMTVRKLGEIRYVYTNLSGKRRGKESVWDIKV